ncbi:MAG: CvpA family protein [Prolixibacteraceae bacterium]
MNYIDYIIVILVVISAIKGATKGLIYELASLLALIGGLWGAIKFSHATKTFLIERLDFNNNYIHIIAFVITFVIIIVLVHLIAKAIEKALESVSLGVANRILGFVFAGFKTLFILGILMILVEKIDESLPFIPENDVQESKFYQPIRAITVSTFPLVQGLFESEKRKRENK